MPPAQRSRHCSPFQMTLKNFAHVPYRKIFSDILFFNDYNTYFFLEKAQINLQM